METLKLTTRGEDIAKHLWYVRLSRTGYTAEQERRLGSLIAEMNGRPATLTLCKLLYEALWTESEPLPLAREELKERYHAYQRYRGQVQLPSEVELDADIQFLIDNDISRADDEEKLMITSDGVRITKYLMM